MLIKIKHIYISISIYNRNFWTRALRIPANPNGRKPPLHWGIWHKFNAILTCIWHIDINLSKYWHVLKSWHKFIDISIYIYIYIIYRWAKGCDMEFSRSSKFLKRFFHHKFEISWILNDTFSNHTNFFMRIQWNGSRYLIFGYLWS